MGWGGGIQFHWDHYGSLKETHTHTHTQRVEEKRHHHLSYDFIGLHFGWDVRLAVSRNILL